jgi:hypothetical protein
MNVRRLNPDGEEESGLSIMTISAGGLCAAHIACPAA